MQWCPTSLLYQSTLCALLNRVTPIPSLSLSVIGHLIYLLRPINIVIHYKTFHLITDIKSLWVTLILVWSTLMIRALLINSLTSCWCRFCSTAQHIILSAHIIHVNRHHPGRHKWLYFRCRQHSTYFEQQTCQTSWHNWRYVTHCCAQPISSRIFIQKLRRYCTGAAQR